MVELEVIVERDDAHLAENGSLFEPLKVEYTKAITGSSSPEDAAKAAGAEFRKILKGWK